MHFEFAPLLAKVRFDERVGGIMQSIGDRPTTQASTQSKNMFPGAPPRVHFCCGKARIRLESLQLLSWHVRNCRLARDLEVLQRLLG